ncbi:hypothetical protein FHS90_001888 [Rufibacter quisquiliarum]|uniref:Uncharacterized protein n=1 Tax=Rufibacter quisquiliarum TaxID=1549639 RepID=A0A839GQK3_9BACT|nr:BRCT domain-containing protein [Rufibacter quisquiliarum]MBA9077177.1 hypothetical protein [Rufibacter quisquiliarum]
MARLGFILLLVLHALIHLLGFVKEFHLTTKHLLTGKTSVPLSPAQAKASGIAWLVACLLFAIAALLYLLRKESWWLWSAGAILLSQCLIFLYWQDAKYGTLANGLLLVVTVVAYGQWQFSQMVQAEKGPFMTAPAEPADPLSPNQVAHLPAPVQRWLHRSNVVGKQPLQTAYLQQQGQLRTSPDGAWMPVQAEQFFTVDTPGFLWVAQVQAAPMVHLAGRDKY